MTLKELAADLYTKESTLKGWLKECNISMSMVLSHNPADAPGEITKDGEVVLRGIHLQKTHPEIDERFSNILTVVFDLRKTIRELEEQISILSKWEK